MTQRPQSIAARLTIALGATTLLVLAVAGWTLQQAMAASLAEADRAKLAAKMNVVVHFVDEATRSANHLQLLHDLDDLKIGHQELGIRITLPDGRAIYGSDPPVPLDGQSGTAGSPPESVDLVRATLPDTTLWPGASITLAQPTQPRERLLRSHLWTLIQVCVSGVVASVSLSWLAIRYCLRPLHQLSRQAHTISAKSLGMRLTVPAEGIELGVLVRSFNDVLARLERSYAQLQAFNANVAHELRTPLASLLTGTQVALSTHLTQESLREALTSNLEELSLLTTLVNDMLFLARADSGDRAEGLERVQLGKEADKAIRYCEGLFNEAGIVVGRVGDALVPCNAALVHRALVNLLTNAIRHTASPGPIQVVIQPREDEVILTVDNPGPPIDAAVSARMFDRFYSASASGADPQPGHGLGLAIVAAIARMHGGSVVADRLGNRNRVGFALPLPTSTQAHRTSSTGAGRTPGACST
jgi:two-component system heavy metal sensor histidine kinase CusS